MNNKLKFEIFVEDKSTTKIYNITKKINIYFKKDDIIRVGKLNNRQLEMYLYRNKDIKTKKHEKKKLISIKILDYVFKNLSKNIL